MRHVLGILATGFALISAWLLYAGFSIETTITAPAGSSLPSGMEGIANLQLMHVQLVNIILGCASAIVCAIMTVGAAMIVVVQDRAEPTD